MFRGERLRTFERAIEAHEKYMAVLGARMLESMKRVAELAQAIEPHYSGHDTVLGSLAANVSRGLMDVLRRVCWRHGTAASMADVGEDEVLTELNTDLSPGGLRGRDLLALVESWQRGVISQETLLENLKRGEVLSEGRSNLEEKRLLKGG